jgi:glucose-6-phosphate 1-dehydrogenase
MIAMEPPARLAPDDIHAEKIEGACARSSRSTRPAWRATFVRGQYEGYRAASPRWRPDSTTETFVALRAEVQNWALGRRAVSTWCTRQAARRESAEIVVRFRETCRTASFPGGTRPNKLVIKLQPEDGLELHLLAAKGASYGERRCDRCSSTSTSRRRSRRTASARTSGCCSTRSRVASNLFVRSDEQEEAWRWVRADLFYPARVGARRTRRDWRPLSYAGPPGSEGPIAAASSGRPGRWPPRRGF